MKQIEMIQDKSTNAKKEFSDCFSKEHKTNLLISIPIEKTAENMY